MLTTVDVLALLVILFTTFEALRQVHSFKESLEALALGFTCWGAFVGILYTAQITPVWIVVFHSGVAMQSSLRYFHRYMKRSVSNVGTSRVISIRSAQVAARQNKHAH